MLLAYVMMNTVPDKMETVLEEIRELKGVEEAYMLYGVYDIIAAVKAGNIEDLKVTILKIRKKEYVSSTLTLLVVS
jgi:DNA-binding Lrp family transcriptional regulator